MLLSSHRFVSVSDIRGILTNTPAVGSWPHELSQLVDKLLCIWIWVKMVREKHDLFFCILNTQDFSDRQCHYAWQTFFTECMYISSNLCMQLGLPSLDRVFTSWFLLRHVVKAALDGCSTSEIAIVLWPGVWWRCDPHSQSFTQHHWPSSTSYTTHTSLQVSLCPVTALGIRISGM